MVVFHRQESHHRKYSKKSPKQILVLIEERIHSEGEANRQKSIIVENSTKLGFAGKDVSKKFQNIFSQMVVKHGDLPGYNLQKTTKTNSSTNMRIAGKSTMNESRYISY